MTTDPTAAERQRRHRARLRGEPVRLRKGGRPPKPGKGRKLPELSIDITPQALAAHVAKRLGWGYANALAGQIKLLYVEELKTRPRIVLGEKPKHPLIDPKASAQKPKRSPLDPDASAAQRFWRVLDLAKHERDAEAIAKIVLSDPKGFVTLAKRTLRRKGDLTRRRFRFIWSCLHSDRTTDNTKKATYAEAFRVLSVLDPLTRGRNEPEILGLPRDPAEWVRRRKKKG